MPEDTKPDEPQYTDPETGKPIIYADNVPELLRGDLTLSPMRQRYAERLDEVTHIERAARGRLAWNLWVRSWAASLLSREESTDQIFVSLPCPKANPFDDMFFAVNGVDFRQDNPSFEVENLNFERFVFPFPVAFDGMEFKGSVCFEGAFFAGDLSIQRCKFRAGVFFSQAQFGQRILAEGAVFERQAEFGGTRFVGNAAFSEVTFVGRCRFVGAVFEGVAEFAKVVFGDLSFFNRVHFGAHTIFDSSIFSEAARFNSAIFSTLVTFEEASFEGRAIFSDAKFEGHVDYSGCCFGKTAEFYNAEFGNSVDFRKSIFSGDLVCPGLEFPHSVDLDEINCKGGLNFEGARFLSTISLKRSFCSGSINFEKVVFLDSVEMESAKFCGEFDAEGAEFRRSLKLGKSRFVDKASFVNCDFKGLVDMDWACFAAAVDTPSHESKSVPDFSGAKFAVPPNLGYTRVESPELKPPQNVWQGLIRFCGFGLEGARIVDEKAASKLRRLQELAANGHHSLAEKQFFRAELLCRRGHETKGRQEVAMINLFELFSRCGTRFWRPAFWWMGLFVMMALIYGVFSNSFGLGNFPEDVGHLFNYTLANSLPLIGVFKSQDTVAVQALFGGASGIPFWSGFMAGVHNLLSSIFLFFALLAVRNYFKLG